MRESKAELMLREKFRSQEIKSKLVPVTIALILSIFLIFKICQDGSKYSNNPFESPKLIAVHDDANKENNNTSLSADSEPVSNKTIDEKVDNSKTLVNTTHQENNHTDYINLPNNIVEAYRDLLGRLEPLKEELNITKTNLKKFIEELEAAVSSNSTIDKEYLHDKLRGYNLLPKEGN